MRNEKRVKESLCYTNSSVSAFWFFSPPPRTNYSRALQLQCFKTLIKFLVNPEQSGKRLIGEDYFLLAGDARWGVVVTTTFGVTQQTLLLSMCWKTHSEALSASLSFFFFPTWYNCISEKPCNKTDESFLTLFLSSDTDLRARLLLLSWRFCFKNKWGIIAQLV